MKNYFSSLSITKKLFVITLLMTVVTVFILGGTLILARIHEDEHRLLERIDLHTRIAAENSTSTLLFGDAETANEILHALSYEPAIYAARIFNKNQQEFARYQRYIGLLDDEISRPQEKNDTTYDHLFNIVIPINGNGKNIGSLLVIASKKELYENLRRDVAITVLVSFLSILISFLISIRLQRFVVEPIKHMVGMVRNVHSNNDYSLRVHKFYEDELGSLSDNLNLMLKEIQVSRIELEALVDDRTKELRKRNLKLAEEMCSRARVQGELYESEKRFRSTFSSAAIGMLLLDSRWRITQANKAALNILGYKEHELQDIASHEIIYEEDRDVDSDKQRKLISGEINSYKSEKRYVRKDGGLLWGLSTVSGVFDENGDFSYAITQLIDITEEHRLSKELTYQANHDLLTGLLNRTAFEKKVRNAWELVKEDDEIHHVLIFINLDQFKIINDTSGHVAGDEILRQITALLNDNVRKQDHVARLGGDEFGILMEYCNLHHGVSSADSIRKKVEQLQFIWNGNRFKVTVSMGVVDVSSHISSVSELLKQADTACFTAKDMGRNKVSVYRPEDEMLEKRRGEMQWVSRLQEALEEDRLVLYTQPIVPTKSEKSGLHFEVLVRLVTPDGVEIPPSAFLPSAERYGLATKVDRWVFNNIIQWMKTNEEFVSSHIDMCSINLSGVTLSDVEFLNMVIDVLCSTDVPAEKICFEITETAMIANLSQATMFIKALRRMSCKFALDDFGSGLSSFAYLKNLQVDYLKIDGMFVRDILDDPIEYGMVRSINEMGQIMGKKTIAEFVENEQIYEKIKEIGVDYAQGYGVGELKPLAVLALDFENKKHEVA